MSSDTTEIILKGISGSPGICIGKAYRVDKEGVDVIEKYSISEDNVKKEIVKNRLSAQDADKYTDLLDKMPPSADFNTLKNILKTKYNLQENKDFAYDRTIARGLDYYTGLIFELKASNKPSDLSIAGGGRYDNLVGMFASKQIPAVGISFGISRLLEIT